MPSEAADVPTSSNAATDPAAIDDATWSAATRGVQRSSEVADEVPSSAIVPDGTTACGVPPAAATISAANSQGTSPQTCMEAEPGGAIDPQPVDRTPVEQQPSATSAALQSAAIPGAAVPHAAPGVPQAVTGAKVEPQRLAANASSQHVAIPDAASSGGPQPVARAEVASPPTAASVAPTAASAVPPTHGDEMWMTSLHVDAIELPVASTVPATLNSLDKGLQHHLRYLHSIANQSFASIF